MANYRSLHVKMWCDPGLESLPGLARCLFAYLITNEHRNEAALYSITIARMAFEMGFSAKEIEKAMAELVTARKVLHDPASSTIWVKNAVRYQTLSPNCIKSIGKDLDHCSSATLAKQFCEYYRAYGDLGAVCQSFLNRLETVGNGFANPPLGIGIGIGLGEEGDVGGEEPPTAPPPPEPKNRPKDIPAVQALFRERGYPNADIEAEKFWNFYTSKGWKVGKNAMQDWKAAAANWGRGIDRSPNSNGSDRPHGYHEMSERTRLKQNDPRFDDHIVVMRADTGRELWCYRKDQKPLLSGYTQIHPEPSVYAAATV